MVGIPRAAPGGRGNVTALGGEGVSVGEWGGCVSPQLCVGARPGHARVDFVGLTPTNSTFGSRKPAPKPPLPLPSAVDVRRCCGRSFARERERLTRRAGPGP